MGSTTLFDGSVPLPTAVLLRDALEYNIALMADYCARHEVLLAPHGKTTMSPEIIGRQLRAGAWAITVATSRQAAAVVRMGARRILIANEIVDTASLRQVDRLLTDHPDLEMLCYVDSLAGVELLEGHLSAPAADRLDVLVELGTVGGRAGVRSDDEALTLARRVASGPLRLAGVAAFERIIDGDSLEATLTLVDALLGRVAALSLSLLRESLLGATTWIATVGGSAYFDRVVAVLPPALENSGVRVVLRSGCYVTHDSGTYERLSPWRPGAQRAMPCDQPWRSGRRSSPGPSPGGRSSGWAGGMPPPTPASPSLAGYGRHPAHPSPLRPAGRWSPSTTSTCTWTCRSTLRWVSGS